MRVDFEIDDLGEKIGISAMVASMIAGAVFGFNALVVRPLNEMAAIKDAKTYLAANLDACNGRVHLGVGRPNINGLSADCAVVSVNGVQTEIELDNIAVERTSYLAFGRSSVKLKEPGAK